MKPSKFVSALILTLVIISFSDLKSQNGVSVDFSYVMMKNTFRIQSQIGYNRILKSSQSVHLYGIVNLFTNQAESYNAQPKLSGIGVGYKYEFRTTQPWLSLMARSNLSYALYPSTWNANIYEPTNEEYINVATSSLEHLINLTAGYGLRINCGKRVYLEQFISGGVYKSILKGGRLVSSDSVSNDVSHDFRRYKDIGFNVILGFGVGFKF